MKLSQSGCIFQQRGVGLLEVLIALLVLSVAALGFAGLQLTALNNSVEANHRAHAALIAQDAIGRMQSNPSDLNRYLTAANWNSRAITEDSAPPNWANCTSNGPCSAEQMTNWDIDQVSWIAANSLPLGRVLAQTCPFNAGMSCVIVSWDEQDPTGCVSAAGVLANVGTTCFVIEVIL